MGFFERYLTLWVFICILIGIGLGHLAPGAFHAVAAIEIAQINLPVAVLIWLMIYPMMLKIDFGSLGSIARRPKGLLVTLFVNWLVKPFSMALIGWLFFRHLFSGWISPADAGLGRVLARPLVATVAATHLPASQAAWLQPSGLSDFYTQPASTTVYYVLTLNAAGTMSSVSASTTSTASVATCTSRSW